MKAQGETLIQGEAKYNEAEISLLIVSSLPDMGEDVLMPILLSPESASPCISVSPWLSFTVRLKSWELPELKVSALELLLADRICIWLLKVSGLNKRLGLLAVETFSIKVWEVALNTDLLVM